MWHTVAEVSLSEHELPSQLGRESPVDEKAAKHTAKGPANALGHAVLLGRVGGRKLLGDARFQAVLLERFARVSPSFVGTPANDSAAARDDSSYDEQVKGVEGAALVLQQADGGPSGELVCDFSDVFETPIGLGGERAHEVAVAELERLDDAGMLSFLRMN